MAKLIIREENTEIQTSPSPIADDWDAGVGEDYVKMQMLQCADIIAVQGYVLSYLASFTDDDALRVLSDERCREILAAAAVLVKNIKI